MDELFSRRVQLLEYPAILLLQWFNQTDELAATFVYRLAHSEYCALKFPAVYVPQPKNDSAYLPSAQREFCFVSHERFAVLAHWSAIGCV